MLKLQVLILFLVLTLPILGQDKPILKDSLKVPKVKKNKKISLKPSGLQLGLDLVPIGTSILDEKFQDYEANLSILLGDRFFATADIGFTQFERKENNIFNYQSQGTYLRLGFHHDFWHGEAKNANGVLSLGLGYALANFQQNADFSINNSYFGDISSQEEQSGLIVSWAVLFASMKAQVFKNLFLGPVMRVKLRVSKSKVENFDIAEIPGFGENKSLNIEFGYQISYGF